MYGFIEDIKENKSLSFFVFLNSLFFATLFLIILLFYYNGKKWYEEIKNININVIWDESLSVEEVNKNIKFILDKLPLSFKENIDREQIKNTLLKNIQVKDDILNEINFPYTSIFRYEYLKEGKENFPRVLSTLKSIPAIRGVVYSQVKFSWLKNWTLLVSTLLVPAFFFVVIMIFMLIFWSIRLLLLSKEEEIEILYLIGASDFYVLKPLLRLSVLILFLSGSVGLVFLTLLHSYLTPLLNSFGLNLLFLPYSYLVFYFILNFFIALMSAYFAYRSLRSKFN